MMHSMTKNGGRKSHHSVNEAKKTPNKLDDSNNQGRATVRNLINWLVVTL